MKSRQNSGAGLCGCLLFFLMGTFLLGAFFFLNFQIETGPAGDVEFPRADQSNVEQHPDAGDWEMEDMGATSSEQPQERASRSSGAAENTRSESGDWSMEEVESNGQRKSDLPSNPKSKSTREGDWELEEVGGKKGN